MDQILINQSVAILCDGNNIERSIHDASKNKNAMINFDTLIPKLLNGRGLNRMIYFREGKSISTKLADRLHENFYGSVIPCHKSADIPLTIKAMKQIGIEILKNPSERDLTLCENLASACFDSEDYKEGRKAFMEKRKPNFRGL